MVRIETLLQCTPPVRVNSSENKQVTAVGELTGMLPNTLLDDIKSKRGSKPIACTEKENKKSMDYKNNDGLVINSKMNTQYCNKSDVEKQHIGVNLASEVDKMNEDCPYKITPIPISYIGAVKGLDFSGDAQHLSYTKLNSETEKGTSYGKKSNKDLRYFPFTHEQDTPIIDLIPDPGAIKRWERCIVGYFLGSSLPYHVMRNEAMNLWNNEGLMNMASTDNGFYFFEFENDESRTRVLEKGIYYIFGKALILKKWHLMLSLNKEDMGKIPVWVKFFNLPYEYWSVDNLSKVASILGRPLYTDQATEQLLRVTYARVCVEIDATKDMYKAIKVRHGDQVVEVKIEYQGLPSRCVDCKVFGHNINSCPLNVSLKTDIQVNDKRVNHSHHPVHNQSKRVHIHSRVDEMQGVRRYNGRSQHWKVKGEENIKDVMAGSSHCTDNSSTDKEGMDNLVVGSYTKRSGRAKLKDRNGNFANIENVKKMNISMDSEIPCIKIGNSFDIFTSLGEEGTVPSTSSARTITDSNPKNKGLEIRGKQKDQKVVELNMGSLPEGVGAGNLVTVQLGCEVDVAKISDSKGLESSQVHGVNSNVLSGKHEAGPNLYEALDKLYALQNADFPEIAPESCMEKIKSSLEIECNLRSYKNVTKTNDETGDISVENPEMDSLLFDAFSAKDKGELGLSEDNLSTPKPKVGLSFNDYPERMSKKKKKLMKAARNAYLTKEKNNEDPP